MQPTAIRTMSDYVLVTNEFHFYKGGNAGFYKVLREYYEVSNHVRSHYQKFRIPKKTKGMRTIACPDDILHAKQYVIRHQFLNTVDPDPAAYAYVAGKGVKENAKMHDSYHRGHPNSILIKLDIQDFFNSIKARDIYSVFHTEYPMMKEDLLTYLVKICSIEDQGESRLPQGASTSPQISNLYFRPLDKIFRAYMEKYGGCYTRYCDDLFFSIEPDKVQPEELIAYVRFHLHQKGLHLNTKKTKIIRKGQRYQVTGVNVGDVFQTGRNYRRRIRQEAYYILQNGLEQHAQVTGQDPQECLERLIGRIQYALYIRPEDKEMQEYLALMKTIRVFGKCAYHPESIEGRPAH
jgi:RNA-directed DNA polymerase